MVATTFAALSSTDSMAVENATWGEERIADELQLKLGIRVSPRTVGKYLQARLPARSALTA